MGAAHSQRWSKYAFSAFVEQKSYIKEEKARNLLQNLAKKQVIPFIMLSNIHFDKQYKLNILKNNHKGNEHEHIGKKSFKPQKFNL